MSRYFTDLKSFDSLTDAVIESTTSITIKNEKTYPDVITIDLSPYVKLSVLNIQSNTRLVVAGLSKCLGLKSLTYKGVKFIDAASESLENLTVSILYDNFNPSAFPNLKSITFDCDVIGKLDISKLSTLVNCEICDITGNLCSISIKHLIYRGNRTDIIFDLPNLESYVGKFNASILTNANIKSIVFEDGPRTYNNLTIYLPKLNKLEIPANCTKLLDYQAIAVVSKLTLNNLDLGINIFSAHIDIYSNVTMLVLNYDFIYIGDFVNRFKCLNQLIITVCEFVVSSNISCPLKHLEINSDKPITINKLKHFNTSKMTKLKCCVNDNETERIDIPTVTELHCNKFILTSKNAPNIKIYDGPLPTDAVLTNVEEIGQTYAESYINVDFTTMPYLKLIGGKTVQQYIESHKNIAIIDPIDINIDAVLAGYNPSNNPEIMPRFNSSYFFMSSTKIKESCPDITFKTIISAIASKLVVMQDQIEITNIIDKMNNVFKHHEYDNIIAVVERLFTALDGKFGIVMDVERRELQYKVSELQKQLDELKQRKIDALQKQIDELKASRV